jgi:hypothetical protein
VGQNLGVYFKGTDRERRIRQLLCDARSFDSAPYARQMDFIFVDGDHSYDGVSSDTEKAFKMLAPSGVILWHDYAPKTLELVRFFKEFTQKKPLFRIRNTSLLVHMDGVDPLSFQGSRRRLTKEMERDSQGVEEASLP